MSRPPNENTQAPILVLTAAGDARAVARALARVLVRRELIFANAIPDLVHCENVRSAG